VSARVGRLVRNFWLWVFVVAARVDFWPLALFAIKRAGAATDWGRGAKLGEDAPW
jgi:hypothetical protein